MILITSIGHAIGRLIIHYLTLLLLFMASIPNSVALTGVIAPTDTADRYPVLDPLYGIDGLRSVANLAERDAIPTERRREGMLVYTRADGKYWKLGATLANSSWSEFSGGAGGNLSNYYTRSETDTEIQIAIGNIPPTDLSGYPNRGEVTIEIAEAIANIPPVDLSYFAQHHEVDTAINLYLSNYMDGNQTNDAIQQAIANIPPPDLSDYPNRYEVSTEIQNAIASIPGADLSNYLDQNQTYDAIQQAINTIPGVDLSNYPTRYEVSMEIGLALAYVLEDPRVKWGVQPNIIDEVVLVGDNRSLLHANTVIAENGDVVLGYSSELMLL